METIDLDEMGAIDKKLSIIIPVYNTEKYLARCIDSLLCQPISSYEIILIDDGSTDGSNTICDKYAMNSPNVVVIHKSNEGVVASRAAGVLASHGEYIAFVDSDDWIDEDYFSEFMSLLDNRSEVDICVSGSLREYPNGTRDRIGGWGHSRIMDQEDAVRKMCAFELFRWEIWGKVYRRHLFDGIMVDKRVRCHEDLDWNWVLFSKARFIFYSCKRDYHYWFYTSSNSQALPMTVRNSNLVFDRILKNMWPKDKEVRKNICRVYISSIIGEIREMFFEESESYEQIIRDRQKTIQYLMKPYDSEEFQNSKNLFFSGDYEECKRVHKLIFDSIQSELKNASRYSMLYVYGTGAIAKYVTKILKKGGSSPFAYVVSDDQRNYGDFMGTCVLKVSDVAVKNECNAFVLAVSDKNIKIVQDRLISFGHRTIYSFLTNPVF